MGISQATILEWVAMSFSRGSSRPRDQTQVSCIAGSKHSKHKGTDIGEPDPIGNNKQYCSKYSARGERHKALKGASATTGLTETGVHPDEERTHTRVATRSPLP